MGDESARISGDTYRVSDGEKAHFRKHGYVHLKGLLQEDEMVEIERVYDQFLCREVAVAGKDFCDMSGSYGRKPEDYSIVNVMLPRRYYPQWQGNVFERRGLSVASQLYDKDWKPVLDYDQLLAKQPYKEDAVFAYHSDLAYWIDTSDKRTATLWLAVDHSTTENGCMRFVAGTSTEPKLRPHKPVLGDRGESHALATQLRADDVVRPVPIRRGDVTVHNERVVHGSGGNRTSGYRRAYVIAFRSEETVKIERARGFTHSHNDRHEVIDSVGVLGETR